MLIISQATAALDKDSEAEIVRALTRLSARKAVLVFTHSEVLMKAASVVHVMEGGVIVESGLYSSLRSIHGLNSIKDS